ncbi:MAG: hypothetical protein GY938_30745 [Ketobacter sp.]|nr:hypothetical protein [Ketobacter sp.]
MKIKPAIRGPKDYCNYADLDVGDTFIYHNQLWMKSDVAEQIGQTAVNMATGEWAYNMCDTMVLPVDAVITWTKIKDALSD